MSVGRFELLPCPELCDANAEAKAKATATAKATAKAKAKAKCGGPFDCVAHKVP